MEWRSIWLLIACNFIKVFGNESPVFTVDLDNLVVGEDTGVDTVIGRLEGLDPEGAPVRFGLAGTDRLTVDPESGELRLVKPLDREVNDTLVFYVTIEDDASNLVQSRISLIISDVNDNPPVFKNEPYEVSIEETTQAETVIFKGILVEDLDLSGDTLEVICKDQETFPNTCENFEITTFNSSQLAYHGGVILKGKLDYSVRQLYQLLLVASDGSYNATSSLEVKVLDVQDRPPEFFGSLTGVIREDDPIGTLVMTIHAKDGDKGNPRKIVYELLTNPLDYFLLEPVTGELRTAKPLDREALSSLQSAGVLSLQVRASEEGGDGEEKSSSVTAVSVTIQDVNDEPPSFNQREYTVQLSESLLPGTPLPNLNMTVTDPDVGVNSKFSLRLASALSADFAVEPTAGSGSTPVSIRLVSGPLDYENPNSRKFILLVIAEETETAEKLASTATVTVEITDANDNPPQFEREAYGAMVEETAPSGTSVTSISATDVDTGLFGTRGILYQLIGDGAQRFEVNEKTGLITVAPCDTPGLTPCLDYETKSTYYLNIKGTDDEGKGQSSFAQVKISLIDTNDNPPVFSSPLYKAVIDEGASGFEPPLVVQVRDPDKTGDISYSIIEGNVGDLFSMDPATGEISVRGEQGLDMRGLSSHSIQLLVQATDGVFTANSSVAITVLDVNNNPPVFEKEVYSVSLSEDTEIDGSVAEVIATDADSGINSQLVYRLEKGAFQDFAIPDEMTGLVRVAAKLDFDRRNSYSIHIIAVDGGTPTLTGTTTLSITILNANDKLPFFSPSTQRAEVKEDAGVGEMVYQLVAADPDVNTSDALSFAISEPVTAIDKNGKQVQGDVFKSFFNVDERSGAVSVASSLQRDVAAIVRLPVTVTDLTAPSKQQGNGTLIITILDVNDSPPVFTPPWTQSEPRYTVELLEEQPEGTHVATFTASDPDSNNVFYSIQPSSQLFEINNITGVVRTLALLDYEETRQVEFTVVATDSGLPPLSSTAQVTVRLINLNDRTPVFQQKEYRFSVEENSPSGTVIGRVTATDGDAGELGEVRYSMSGEESESSGLIVDGASGELSVKDPRKLDRELRRELSVQVTATDGASVAEAKTAAVLVHVEIVDANDNSPQFSQHEYSVNIVETIPLSPPAPILQLRAEDKDTSSQLRYSILDGNIRDVFLLEPESGILYPQTSLQGGLSDYRLQVQVSDGLFTDRAVIHINVQAINQNQPVFIEPPIRNSTVYIKENAVAPGEVVLRVKALDADSGENGRLSYHFKVRNDNLQETEDFRIDPDSGEIRSKGDLDRELKSSYHLVVVARDHGAPTWHEAIRPLTLQLIDVDDNLPIFNQQYVFTVSENSPPYTKIGVVEAVDGDEGDNGKVYYYLISGEGADSAGPLSFQIDRLDGSLRTGDSNLDREQRDSYQLFVKATNDPDYYPSKEKVGLKELLASSSVAQITIHVLDENDNPPIFDPPLYNAGVLSSEGREGELVTQLVARDPDAGLNGSLTWTISASHLYRAGSEVSSGSVVPSPFAISPTGRLTTAALFSEYNQERFKLEVIAKERALPYREAKAIVNVWVYDVEQLIRVILSRPPSEVLREREQISSELGNLTGSLVVIDQIKYHVKSTGEIHQDWSDMYLHVVDRKSLSISTIPDVLRLIDSKYDSLKDYYVGFAIENIVPASGPVREEGFEPALAALIALLIVLFLGSVSVIVVCCCFTSWIVSEPVDMKQSDMLIKKTVMDDLNTTENPLWIEQKLKLYEEQELTMQVFCEPENNGGGLSTPADGLRRRDSADMSLADNTYATIGGPRETGGRTGSLNTMLCLGAGDYATLGGSVLPLDNVSSHSQQMLEAALGFQGSTFQVPENGELFRTNRSELGLNKDGQPEFVSELI